MRDVFETMRDVRSRWRRGYFHLGDRLLSELGQDVIVAHARNVHLIGESRKKDVRLDARTLARLAQHRSVVAVSGEEPLPKRADLT